MPASIASDAFVGRRVTIERSLVCAGAGQFPVLARGGDVLAIALRAGGDHYGLGGTLATTWSDDGGRTWSEPIDAAPRGSDVRNPAFAILPDGRWLLAYWRAGTRCYPGGTWRLPEPIAGEPDLFVVTSADRGRTWSAPVPQRSEQLAWASPYGRMIACGDALVMAAYGPPIGATQPGTENDARASDARSAFDAIVLRSRDGGATWGDESRVLAGASELALCAVGDVLVGAVRRAAGDTAIVTSRDAGTSWSEPVAVTREGLHPGDLCVLAGSGKLLLTFGRRIRPLGCGALISSDRGATWSNEVMLAGDGIGNDVGYPSTVQLDSGTLVTALYFARGSGAEWGELTCQVLHYDESLVA